MLESEEESQVENDSLTLLHISLLLQISGKLFNPPTPLIFI